MKDGIIKENGASRLVKGSLPATYDEFKALAASAGVPVDVLFNAAGWQQLPTFLNKANLLQDFTATLLGLDPADDPTVDDAFLNVFLTSANAGLLKIRVYETGTQTPIGGVRITGVTDMLGGDLYADDNGLAVGMATSETSTLQVDTAYIDLTGQTVFSGATPAQQITEVTLYATRVSNPDGKIETFTASTQKMFTDAVGRVDVQCVGPGAGGSRGKLTYELTVGWQVDMQGGYGGGQGKSVYQNSVSFAHNELFPIVIGAGGTGAAAKTANGNSNSPTTANVSFAYGTAGGNTTCLGVTAAGGSNIATIGAQYDTDGTSSNANSAASSTIKLFDTQEEANVGGNGGGGGVYNFDMGKSYAASNGGSPYGGNGRQSSSDGDDATGPGGGGGGGGVFTNNYVTEAGGGGNGGDGAVFMRWFYT